jgi:hypothetical protein
MRQRMLYGLFLLCILKLGISQNKCEILQLNNVRKLHNIQSVPFNDVTVIDNRYDTTKLKVIPDGSLPPHALIFSRPASIVISDYIRREVSGLPKNRPTFICGPQTAALRQ